MMWQLLVDHARGIPPCNAGARNPLISKVAEIRDEDWIELAARHGLLGKRPKDRMKQPTDTLKESGDLHQGAGPVNRRRRTLRSPSP